MTPIKYLIVGQGLAGTLLSFFLAKNNIAHKVIAARTLPSASAVAAGLFNPLVFRRLTKSWMVDDLLPIMNTSYRELELLLSTKLVYPLPINKLIQPEEKVWWRERIENQQLQAYFKGFYVPKAEEGIRKPFEIARLLNTGFVDLKALITNYRELLQKQDRLINEDFNYNDLQLGEQHISWKGIDAEKIIFCEGSFANRNPYFPENIFYLVKGDVLTAYIPGLSEEYIINKDIFIMPKGRQHFLIGSTYEREQLNWEVDVSKAEGLLQKAGSLINLPITLVNHEVGIRPTVKDRRPVLGFHPQHKRIGFFNGLGTKGVMLAPYFAKEMVLLLTKKNYESHPEVQLNRFTKVH